MGTGPMAFVADLEELERVVGRLASCGADLEALADELIRRVRLLHDSWAGEAATAHEIAQHDWDSDFGDLREALATMQAAAHVAHQNYSRAAGANVAMWEQLR